MKKENLIALFVGLLLIASMTYFFYVVWYKPMQEKKAIIQQIFIKYPSADASKDYLMTLDIQTLKDLLSGKIQ